MSSRRQESRVSSHYDGEPSAPSELQNHLDSCSACQEMLRDWAELSNLLAVPEPEADPSFVARFRQRRDGLSGTALLGAPWRWLAVRLLPLSTAATMAAVLTLWIGAKATNGDFQELESQALRDGLAAVVTETGGSEWLLGIDLDESSRGASRAE